MFQIRRFHLDFSHFQTVLVYNKRVNCFTQILYICWFVLYTKTVFLKLDLKDLNISSYSIAIYCNKLNCNRCIVIPVISPYIRSYQKYWSYKKQICNQVFNPSLHRLLTLYHKCVGMCLLYQHCVQLDYLVCLNLSVFFPLVSKFKIMISSTLFTLITHKKSRKYYI